MPHPVQKFWYEWNGEHGNPRYYDKEADAGDGKKGANVEMKLPFTFILLDQLAVINGWCESRKSGIISNEVRDSQSEPMVVRLHKGGIIARGLYQEIKERITSKSVGGHFTASLYIAFKGRDGKLLPGSLRLKGAALKSWSDFKSANRGEMFKQAIIITGYKDGKKGSIKFRTPVFALKPISAETLKEAIELDKVIQQYLEGYFKRTRVDQAHTAPQSPTDEAPPSDNDFPPDSEPPTDAEPPADLPPEDDQVPF